MPRDNVPRVKNMAFVKNTEECAKNVFNVMRDSAR
jgi:hypothetical protein